MYYIKKLILDFVLRLLWEEGLRITRDDVHEGIYRDRAKQAGHNVPVRE